MKYAIYDFSQAELVKFNDAHPKEKLDVTDLMIFRWFTHFAAIPKTRDGRTAMRRKVFDGEIYYWVNYHALIEEFPLFDIQTKKSISRRFDKYVSGGLMKKKVYKARNKGSLTFFAFTQEFSRFEYDENNAEQKINPHGKAAEVIQDECPSDESDFRENANVLSKPLERTQTSALKRPTEVREDVDVLSKPLERTQTSAPLNDTPTNSNSSATSSKSLEISQIEVAEESLITQELKNLFGGHLVFDSEFVPEISRLLAQFEVKDDGISEYLRFVFDRTTEKKPNSVTNLFYKLAKSAAIMQDFVLEKKKSDEESKKDSVTCPVCGNENAKRFQPCPTCQFDLSNSADENEIRRSRQVYTLPESEKQRFLAEYNEEIRRQLSVGFLEKMRNPQMQQDFRKRIAEIYRKYGITA